MTPFQEKGWTKDKVLEEQHPEWYPKGTRLRLSMDDGSEFPLFESIDGTVSARGGTTAYICLRFLREVERPVKAKSNLKSRELLARWRTNGD